MGADRWSVCPGCLKEADTEHEYLKSRIENEYGQIPREEWMALHTEVDRLGRVLADPAGHLTHLKQVFDFTMTEDGHFEAKYHGYCTKPKSTCGFDFGFTHEQQVLR